MNSPFTSNDPESVTRESSRKRKRRKIATENRNEMTSNKIRWRTEAQQRIYSSKLIEALRKVRRSRSSSETTAKGIPRGREVLDAADRALAVTAKGKTRWSRAILRTNRLRLRLKKVKKQKMKLAGGGGDSLPKKRPCVKKKLPALHRRLRVLGRLVPGCRKLPFSNLLEEATDYIAALEMQVRTMAALADLLTGAASSSGSGLAAPGEQLDSNLTSSS